MLLWQFHKTRARHQLRVWRAGASPARARPTLYTPPITAPIVADHQLSLEIVIGIQGVFVEQLGVLAGISPGDYDTALFAGRSSLDVKIGSVVRVAVSSGTGRWS